MIRSRARQERLLKVATRLQCVTIESGVAMIDDGAGYRRSAGSGVVDVLGDAPEVHCLRSGSLEIGATRRL
jgi:hypothetical protein